MIHFLVFLLLSSTAKAESGSVHNLTFMFVTASSRSGFDASGSRPGVVPAADIALEDINSNADVLQGYHLVYDEVKDSQV